MADDEPPTKRRKTTNIDPSHISQLLERCVVSEDEKQDDTIAIMPYLPHWKKGEKPNGFQLVCSDGKLVQTLIDSGVSPTAQVKYNCDGNKRFTPLFLIAMEGFPEAVRVLLDNGASPSVSLLENETDDEMGYLVRGAQPLHACVYDEQQANKKDVVTMVRYLLGAGASPLIKDIMGDTPLKLALQNRHFEAAKLMLERALSLNCTYPDMRKGKLPDREAFLDDTDSDEDGDDGYTSEEIDQDCYDDDYYLPLLHLAAKMGAVEIVDMLVSLPDCDINESASKRKGTPLHFACESDPEGFFFEVVDARIKQRMVSKLLDHGADPTLVDWKQRSPLHWLGDDSKDPEKSVLYEFAMRGGLATQVLISFEKEYLGQPKVKKTIVEGLKEAILLTETSLVKPAKKD